MKRLMPLCLLLLGAEAVGDGYATLKSNPFSRPPSAVLPTSTGIATTDGAIPEINLRATMVGAGLGLANVGGRVLKPGQTIEELTLMKVYEDRAVFLYRGDRLTVYVKPHLNESENDE